MRNNVCIIGLNIGFTKVVAKQLADNFDMFYADVNELLEYDLTDIVDAEKKSGRDYILKLETNKVKTVSDYEKTIFTVGYSALINHNNYEILKQKTAIIYLKLNENQFDELLKKDKLTPSQKKLEATVFSDRDKFCSSISSKVVTVDNFNVDDAVLKLSKVIKVL